METFSSKDFLSAHFNLPAANARFVPKGAADAKNAYDGYPAEALVDNLWVFRNIKLKGGELALKVRKAKRTIIKAYTGRGNPCNLLGKDKRPHSGGGDCGKQGFTLDGSLLSTNLLGTWKNGNVFTTHIGFQTSNQPGGIVVFDLDDKNGNHAPATFCGFLEKNGMDWTKWPIVYTPSGGLHIPFQADNGLPIKNWTSFAPAVWGGGVDLKGTGGYVVAAGSFARDNGEWKQYYVLNNAPIPTIPDCVADVIDRWSKPKAHHVPGLVRNAEKNSVNINNMEGGNELAIACRIVCAAHEGTRNTALNNAAFGMGKLVRDKKLDREAVEAALGEAAMAVGLGEGEIAATLKSGLDGGMASEQPYEPYDDKSLEPGIDPASEFNGGDRKSAPRSKGGKDMYKQGQTAQARPMPAQGQQYFRDIQQNSVQSAWQRQQACDPKLIIASEKDRSYRPGRLGFFANPGGVPWKVTSQFLCRSFHPALAQAFWTVSDDYDFDLRALACLGVTSASLAIANTRRSKFNKTDRTHVAANLYALTIAESGDKKSLVMDTFLWSLKERHKELAQKYKNEMEAYKEKLAEWDKTSKRERGPKLEKPIRQHLYSDDFSIEAIVEANANNDRGMAIIMDEAANLGNFGADRYNDKSSAAARKILIQGYNGGPMSVMRKSHDGEDQSQDVPNLVFSAALNIQPKFLAKTFDSDSEAQGFLQRFVFIPVPSSPDGDGKSPVGDDDDAVNADFQFIDKWMDKLLDLKIAPEHRKEYKGSKRLRMDHSAVVAYNEWYHRFRSMCNYGRLKPYVRRLADSMLKVILIIHYMNLAAECVKNDLDIEEADKGCKFLTAEDVERAIPIMNLFIENTDWVLWQLKKPMDNDVLYLDELQQAFAKHIQANVEYYSVPRTSKEIYEKGFMLAGPSAELTKWLKAQGFQTIRKGHREARFVDLAKLEPWENSVNLSRGVFDENPLVEPAQVIHDQEEAIEKSGYEVTVDEFKDWVRDNDASQDVDKIVSDMVANPSNFLVIGHEDKLLFRPESFEIADRILREEGRLSPAEVPEEIPEAVNS